MRDLPERRVKWLGTAALALGGCNLTLYTMGSLVQTYGSIIVVLFIVGLLLSYCTSIGFLELVLMFPNKTGGITTACTEAFKPYSPIITNIVGVGYWFAWLMAASFAATYAATVIQQSLPWISINWVSTFLIVGATLLNLCGLKWTQRFAIPIALMASFLGLLTLLIPVFAGAVVWEQAFSYTFISPFQSQFGKLSTLMAALYLVGWIVPGYENVFCYVNETINPQKNVPRALYMTMALASLFYGVLPLIWLGVIGMEALSQDLIEVLAPVYTPLFKHFAQAGITWFILFNLIICLIAPLAGPSRTMSQLARDGLVPQFFGITSRLGVPWVSLLITASIAICIIFFGAPTWLIAATNFQYLLAISLASIAVWLLRKNCPTAPRLFRAPSVCIYLGLFAACIWTISTILGFRQYELGTMITGFCFSSLGVLLFFWRKINDRIEKNLSLFPHSLHFKLSGTMLCVLIFDAIGYLIAVNSLAKNNEYALILEDIFVIVALLTLTAGLIIPGKIVHAAEEVNLAAKRIININLAELSLAMEKLGTGNLNDLNVSQEVIPIAITSQDEMGQMAASFNRMQEEIKKTSLNMNFVRDRLRKAMDELNQLNQDLEQRVIERTEKLEASNRQLQNEIADRKKAEEKALDLHSQLVVAAREAGMADIARSTLHNIGNVLTSVSTSASILQEKVRYSRIEKLNQLSVLLQEHEKNLDEFLTKDEKGKIIPNYLTALAQHLNEEKNYILDEIHWLQKNINHINDIIVMQQSLSKTLGVVEDISVADLIKDALAINKVIYEGKNIHLEEHIEPISTVTIDRVKLLQIIVNLFKNSIESLLECSNENKTLKIMLRPVDEQYFKLQVQDNGLGILSHNLQKIFTAHFTTKKSGHGFGLHSSSLAANEMGGELTATSEGLDKGALFTLILPYKNAKANS
ncbi:amino acid permease [Legionella sp. km772]|uniref:amino acid permease n=1 Tax=Legionella sp. km772 TaxID=2498111 RepID=UPI000F8D31B9|nr:amino acid permease [Legionella sp. km772]RUR07601.1 amino acid permease [Legionella sp. km772]